MVDAGGASFRGTFGSNVGLKKKISIGRKKKKKMFNGVSIKHVDRYSLRSNQM